MASIRRVVHRTGRMSWQARWRDPTGRQHSKNFGRRIDAEQFLITIEARKLAGTYIDPRAGRIRLGEFTEQATAGWVNRRDSTKARDESYLRSLVLPVFADMPIGAINVFDVQEWVSDLDADGTPQPPSARPTNSSDGSSTTPSTADSSPAPRAGTSPCPRSRTPRSDYSPPKRSPSSPTPSIPDTGPSSSPRRTRAVASGNSSPSTPTATSQTNGSSGSNDPSLKSAATSASDNPRPQQPAEPCRYRNGCPTSSTSTWPTTRPDPTV